MRVCSASLHPTTKLGLQNPRGAPALPLGVDPVEPVHSWASKGSRGLVGPVAPVLAKVGALGQGGLPVQVLPPPLRGKLAEVTKLGRKKRGNELKMCWGAARTPQFHHSPSWHSSILLTAALRVGKALGDKPSCALSCVPKCHLL